jgi:Site-specific recombinase XerD
MKEQFVNEFLATVCNNFDSEQLNLIKSKLFIFVDDWEVKRKETEIIPYIDYIPNCYETYFVTKKIEGMSMKSLSLYKMILDDFFMKVHKPLKDINVNDIRIYLYKTQEERKISNRTLDERRIIINTFMEWSTNEGYIEKNPCRNIKAIKYERREKESLTDVEIEMIRNNYNNIRDKALVEFIYSTGCRVTEVSRVNIDDVNFETNELIVFGKGDKHRKVYLNAKTKLALQDYLKIRDDDNEALFVGLVKPYNRLAKSAIEKIVRDLGVKAGLKERLYPHKLRRTYATVMLDRGADLAEVQKALGHVNVGTTTVYAKALDSNIKNKHKKCII